MHSTDRHPFSGRCGPGTHHGTAWRCVRTSAKTQVDLIFFQPNSVIRARAHSAVRGVLRVTLGTGEAERADPHAINGLAREPCAGMHDVCSH